MHFKGCSKQRVNWIQNWKKNSSVQDVAVSTLKHCSAQLWWQEPWCEQVAEQDSDLSAVIRSHCRYWAVKNMDVSKVGLILLIINCILNPLFSPKQQVAYLRKGSLGWQLCHGWGDTCWRKWQFAWHPEHRADLGHKSQGNCLMLHIYVAAPFFIALPALVICMYLFCQCLDFESLSVSVTFKVQDTALCLVVWNWCWVLCVGEEFDEERPVNLKEPIQPTRGYWCVVDSCGLPRKNGIQFVPLNCERATKSGCTCV